ncbi:hypothetical protein DENSPDRAFT_842586 [Dentipellis sp. KUC8613]|nr:hypothetical protein DENSPDRAFT_842586 [Dentipellis sp. KUC8613]
MANETVVPPGGQFTFPPTSVSPLLALRCTPALRPYLPEDASSSAEILVDALVRYSQIDGAVPIAIPGRGLDTDAPQLQVTASINGQRLAHGTVALNGSTTLSFSLSHPLSPRLEPYNITCSATLGGQTFQSSAELSFLPSPPPHIGSVTKFDSRTGALLARPVGQKSGAYKPILPLGYYTDFDGYLAANLSSINELKEQGFNIIHPVPTFDNLTALNLVVDRMEEQGLYLMYDMRYTYMNSSSVTEQVTSLRNRTNLLLYYTGDEPDGTSDRLNATTTAYDLIKSLDPYRPTSLVLNCQDYFFSDYAAGADIVMQDVYEIGNNVTFSSEWHTPCTPERGDCGCDNCKGRFEDIRDRVTEFQQRFEVLGWERTKRVWTVPQAFGGGDEYWVRAPTGAEWLVEAIVGINAGALGVVSWNDPTTPDIKAASSMLALALPTITPFILPAAPSPPSTFRHVITPSRVDVGVWTLAGETRSLVLAVNLNYANASIALSDIFGGGGAEQAEKVFEAGAEIADKNIVFRSIGSGAWVVEGPVRSAV